VSLKHTLSLAPDIILHNVINARREKHKTEENEEHPETEITQREKKKWRLFSNISFPE